MNIQLKTKQYPLSLSQVKIHPKIIQFMEFYQGIWLQIIQVYILLDT
jgi:hypothetical protein